LTEISREDDEKILALDERSFRASIVYLILSRSTERAVDLVSKKFHVRTPSLAIGHTKGKKIALAVYSVASNAISFSDQKYFFDPFVVLHEMYHCVRSTSGIHRGTEKNADKFALDYIAEYNKFVIASNQRAIKAVETDSVHAPVD
jgi:hypothetical protein